LHRVESLARAIAAAVCIIAAFPARKTPVQVAALSAAALISVELVTRAWLPSYAVWFAPFVFVALFTCEDAEPTSALAGHLKICRESVSSRRA
jgi:hypothetical protein